MPQQPAQSAAAASAEFSARRGMKKRRAGFGNWPCCTAPSRPATSSSSPA